MQIGPFRVTTHNHGLLRLDGGAMFGTVPKPLWSKRIEPDDQNRIPLATRSLIVEWENGKLLVDTGCGDKWNEKSRAIYALDATPYEPVPGVTDLLLTHLHFDHAGGLTRWGEDQSIAANYPNAVHYASQANLANAREPNIRERGSYLAENVDILDQVPLQILESDQELAPGISVHQVNGHTHGLLWVKVTDADTTVVFPSDLIPSSNHLPLPYVMGYDICAATAMAEKEAFLRRAIDENWIVLFQHDPFVEAAQLQFDARGYASIIKTVNLS